MGRPNVVQLKSVRYLVNSGYRRRMRIKKNKVIRNIAQISSPNIPVVKQLITKDNSNSISTNLTDYKLYIRTDKCKTETALHVCLVNEDGAAILHRVDAINNNIDSNHDIRFQTTETDTDYFSAPLLPNLSGLIVGPESGELYLEDIEVHYNGNVNKFVWRGFLGATDCSACWMQVVKPGNVVLASGKQVSQEEADEIKAQNLEDYQKYKNNSYKILGVLLVVGTLLVYLFADFDGAKAFLFGGLVGGLLQLQTQQKLDKYLQQGNSQNNLLFSLVVVGVAVALFLNNNEFAFLSSYPLEYKDILKYLLFGLLGFSLNKVSLAIAVLSL